MARHLYTLSIAMSVTSLALLVARPATAETVTLGIGTQDTTTNTVTAGVVIRQLRLLEKYLPKDGKYANIKFELEWQNFTSGPPVTNAMMANKLQIGMMGDYPLIVNGFTFDSNPESKSRLIGIAAYSLRAPATAWSSTRIPLTTISPISRASSSACRSVRPPTAWF